jgi:hypothetical protein
MSIITVAVTPPALRATSPSPLAIGRTQVFGRMFIFCRTSSIGISIQAQ